METTIASLEEKLAMALQEKEEAISRNVDLASELESISKNLDLSSSELTVLQEEVSGLVCSLSSCFPYFFTKLYCHDKFL